MKKISIFEKSRDFSRQINDLIPGGSHTYSKGDDQFPLNSPAAITHGKGARVWDLDGNEYIDCSMGLTSVSIGHGYEPVAKAVADAAYLGTNFQRPAKIELEAANLFLDTVKSGDMVKFAKNGSNVTTAAVKLARAFTGKNRVAVCKEHNFFSFDDWFIVTTPTNRGIPERIHDMTTFFSYNSFESVENLFLSKEHDIACLILEPAKFDPPKDDFLQRVAEICKKNNALLILDEMVSGFKWSTQGAHRYFSVDADLYTWGKGIANGFSACALTGSREVMELGGIRAEGSDKLFLMSSTHGAETTGLAALMATINAFKEFNMIESNWERGSNLKLRIIEIIHRHQLQDLLQVIGYPCLLSIACRNPNGQLDDGFRTLLMQEMIERGVLFQGLFYTTWSHQIPEIEHFLMAFDEACSVYKNAIVFGGVDSILIGRAAKPVFRKKI